jgi:hypothetical protein
VVSRNDNDVTTGRFGDLPEKLVVKLLRAVAWSRIIENVPRNDENIHFLKANRVNKPSEKGFKLVVALAAAKHPANMPVGGM